MDQTILFQTFNSYPILYPDRKVVGREILDLSKNLRSHGYDVRFLPEDERPLQWLTYKGVGDLINDPVVFEVGSTIYDIVLGLISAWVYGRWNKSRDSDRPKSDLRLAIESARNGKKVRAHYDGKKLSDAQYAEMLHFALEKQQAISKIFAQPPPDSDYPWPVFLEHTTKHVGWAKIWQTDPGLRTETQLFDSVTQERVEEGDLTSLSIAGIVRQSECSTCLNEYAKCPHIAGESYDAQECSVHIKGIDICDFSIVKNPVNPDTRIDRYNLDRDV